MDLLLLLLGLLSLLLWFCSTLAARHLLSSYVLFRVSSLIYDFDDASVPIRELVQSSRNSDRDTSSLVIGVGNISVFAFR